MPPSDDRVAYVLVSHHTAWLAEKARTSILARRPRATVRIVRADRPRAAGPLGYAAALNLGISTLPSAVEFVACLNSDVLMTEPDEPVLDLFDSDPEVAIVGPRQVDEDRRIAHGGIVPHGDGTDWDLDLHHRCWLWRWNETTDDLTSWTFEVPMVAGSVLYARRSALRSLGGWPEFSPFYFEDAAICYLARHRGLRVLYTGRTTWTHYGERGSKLGTAEREARMEVARAGFVLWCAEQGIPVRDALGEAA